MHIFKDTAHPGIGTDSLIQLVRATESRKDIHNQPRPTQIAGQKVAEVVRKDGTKFILESGEWLMVRFSGTEPLVRIYCETTQQDKVDPILADGLKLAGIKA